MNARGSLTSRVLPVVLPLAALACDGACIPDLGLPADAGVERAPLPDAGAEPGPMLDAPPGEPAPDMVAATCGTPNRELMLTGMNDLYMPDTLMASIGDCVHLCVKNADVHPHINSSDDNLFESFTTNAGDDVCVVFKKVLAPGPHGITCLNHPVQMKAKVIAQ